jgi:hypothetical protein
VVQEGLNRALQCPANLLEAISRVMLADGSEVDA